MCFAGISHFSVYKAGLHTIAHQKSVTYQQWQSFRLEQVVLMFENNISDDDY